MGGIIHAADVPNAESKNLEFYTLYRRNEEDRNWLNRACFLDGHLKGLPYYN